jgi:hypothetical protein
VRPGDVFIGAVAELDGLASEVALPVLRFGIHAGRHGHIDDVGLHVAGGSNLGARHHNVSRRSNRGLGEGLIQGCGEGPQVLTEAGARAPASAGG